MKFFTYVYVALVGTAASVRLLGHQHHTHMVEHSEIPSHKQLLELKAALNVMELPEWKDAEKAMEDELERDGSLTKEELKHGL